MVQIMKKIKNTMLYKKYKFWCKYILKEKLNGQKKLIKKRYKQNFQKELDLDNPRTLNEKIQWLKINERDDFHTLVADKYKVREYLKTFSEQYLVPLLFQTTNYKDINEKNITTFPCIVKSNTGCGWYKILRTKEDVNWDELRELCKDWMSKNFYYYSYEWQYKNIKPCIIVEKLLLTKDNKLPNDFKLHFINGDLKFVYCSIDRSDKNYRKIYSPNWELLDFQWPIKQINNDNFEEISKPASFDKMLEIGKKIAKKFKYVRIDFYDVDGNLYFGEITLHHGAGFNKFSDEKYDKYYGAMLKLK